MSIYNFSKLSYTDVGSLYNAIIHIGRLADTPFTTEGIGKALDSIRFADLQELGLGTRRMIGEHYDKCYVFLDADKRENSLRLALIRYLDFNDPNGVYHDDDLLDEGWDMLTLPQALAQVQQVFADD